LKAGYEAEEMLRYAGDGDENAKAKVMSILEEIERTRLLSRANAAIAPKKEVVKRALPAPYPGSKPVLETRPRPKEELGGSGLRKIPKFISANGLPMLRFSKRHSPFLSRVIRQKVLMQMGIHRRIETQEAMFKMGKEEDHWEELMEQQWRKETGRREFTEVLSWTSEMRAQVKRDYALLNEESRKSRVMAQKMLEVVRKEEELAAMERGERKRERNPVRERVRAERYRKRWRENLGLKAR